MSKKILEKTQKTLEQIILELRSFHASHNVDIVFAVIDKLERLIGELKCLTSKAKTKKD